METNLKKGAVLITGANGGIAVETVKLLVKEEGVHRIALACRTKDKAEGVQSILASSKIEAYGGFDMNNATSIENGVHSLPKNKQFDIVFLQSGGVVFENDFQFIKTGNGNVEKTIYQNAFGGYITILQLEKNGLLAKDARIVFAGGEGARGIKGLIESPNFKSTKEINQYVENGIGKYNPMNAIGVSKFVSALIVQELAETNAEREYVWFSPGLTGGTKGLDALPKMKRFIMKNIAFPILQAIGFAQGPKQAAKKYVDALLGNIGHNGDVIGAPEGKALGKLVDQKPMNAGLTNYQFRKTIWDILTVHCGNINKVNLIVNN